MILVADASSIILLSKCSLLRKLSSVARIVIPSKVFEESAGEQIREKHPDAGEILQLVEEKKIEVKAAKGKLVQKLGESETLLLYKEMGADVVLTDDGFTIKVCRALGIPFLISPRVAVDLCRKGVISFSEGKQAIEKLRIFGRYSEDIIASALLALGREE